jgi:peptidyl-Lys metalloendopeptidase
MFAVYVAAAFLSALAVNAAPSVSLKVSGSLLSKCLPNSGADALAIAPSNIVDVDNLSVHATITNTGDETLKLLRDPRSALNTFDAHTFNVAGANGASPFFKGARVCIFKVIERSTG